MKPLDIRLLCTALSFTAIVTRDGQAGSEEVSKFATLIEEFCQSAVPEAFEEAAGDDPSETAQAAAPGFTARARVVERMADAIVEFYKVQAGCLPQDLLAKSFTADEIAKHWTMARALAAVSMNMSDS